MSKKTTDTQNLIQSLTDDMSEVRPLKSPARRATFWAFILLLLVACVSLPLKSIHYEVTLMFQTKFILESLIIVLIGYAALFAGFKLSVPDIQQSKTPFVLLGGATAFWVAVNAYLFLKSTPAALSEQVHHIQTHYCMAGLGMITLLPAVAIYFALKKSAPSLPAWTGYAALLAVSSFAAVAMRYICPNESYAHLFIHHFSPALLLSFFGLLIGNFLLRW